MIWLKLWQERVTVLLFLIFFISVGNILFRGKSVEPYRFLPLRQDSLERSALDSNLGAEVSVRSREVIVFYDLPDILTLAGQSMPLDVYHVRVRAERLWFQYFRNINTRASSQARLVGFTQSMFRYKLNYIEQRLELDSLPDDLKFVWVYESGLEDSAVSWAGATGACQFMSATARAEGLRQNSFVDERRFFEAAMRSCINLVKRLYQKYGDWWLVLAAYNCGPGCVDQAIRRHGGERNYFNLVFSTQETRNYVFQIVFTKEFLTRPERYGFRFRDFSSDPLFYFREDTLVLRRRTAVLEVANRLGISVPAFLEANPFFLNLRGPQDIIPRGTWRFRVPVLTNSLSDSIADSAANINLFRR